MAEMKVVPGKIETAETDEPGVIALNIVGKHLVPEKLLGIAYAVAEELVEPPGVRIVFGNFEDDNLIGHAYPDVRSIKVNLIKIWNDALARCEHPDNPGLSIRLTVWMSLISTIAHEFHHLHLYSYDKEAYADEDLCEEMAQEFEEHMLVKLAKRYDIEPPAWADMVVFAQSWMQLNMDEDWKDTDVVKRERAMAEKGLLYIDGKNKIEIPMFREYIRVTCGDPKCKDPEYDQSVIPITATTTREDGTIEKVEAVDVEELPKPEEKAPEDGTQEALFAVEASEADDVPFDDTPDEEMALGAAGEHLFATESEPEFIGEGLVEEPPKAVAAAAAQAPAQTAQVPNVPPAGATATAAAPQMAVPAAAPAGESDMAVLPQAIMAEQQQMAAAANMKVGPTPETPNAVPNNNLSVEVVKQAMHAIYMRLYANVMNKCGRTVNSDIGYTEPGNVLEPVAVSDIIQRFGAHGLVLEYETFNNVGQKTTEKFQGHIRGIVYRKKSLPAYEIYFNLGGRRCKRVMVPQNPATGKSTALEAKAGHAIAWVINGDLPRDYQGDGKFIAMIKDNVYTAK